MLTWIALLLIAAPLQAQQQGTLMQYVMLERPVLAGLLTRAGLSPVLSGQQNFTLLVPPESMLAVLEQKPSQEIRTVLAAHILIGYYTLHDLKDGASIKTLAGTKATILRKNGHTLVSGVRIVVQDIRVKNGVLHAIEDLISP